MQTTGPAFVPQLRRASARLRRRGTAAAPFGSDLDPGRVHRGSPRRRFSTRAAVWMHHVIFKLADGDRERAKSFLQAKRWVVSREEHHRDVSLPAISRSSSSRWRASSSVASSLRRRSSIQCGSRHLRPAVSGVLLGDVDDCTSGLPLDVAVKRIGPKGSHPY
jgi:hypothetical protein